MRNKSNLISCPICRRKDFRVFYKSAKRQVVGCKHDGLVFVNPQPTKSQVLSLYGSKYFKNFDPYLKNRQAHLAYFNKKLDQIEKRISKGKVLDVGCATGFLLEEAKKRGWQELGVDVSSFAVNYCWKQGLLVKKGTIAEIRFPNKSFNVVTSLQTIEHEIDPLEHLKEIYRILSPGGMAVLTTPDHNALTRKLMGKGWFGYRHKEHLFFFTRKTLGVLFKKAGFSKVEFKKDDSRPFRISYCLTRLVDFYPGIPGIIIKIVNKFLGGLAIPIPTDPWGDIIIFATK